METRAKKEEQQMDENKLGVMEGRFADMIWASAPISTGDLVKACQEAFGWKRTTTYTMLKRLCQRGIFENDNGTVVVLILSDKEADEIQHLIDKSRKKKEGE